MNLYVEIKRLLLKHWDLKFIALALAVILRLVIVGDKVVERLIPDVQLEFRNLPEGLEIASPSRNRFDVLLLAPAKRQVQGADLAVVADMKECQVGTNVLFLGSSSVIVPEGVEVMRVNPSRLVVPLEKTLQKKVRVIPATSGSVPAGYEIFETRAEPPEVTVSGPSSRILTLEKIPTEPIPVEGQKDTVQAVVNILDDLPGVRVEPLEPIQVTLKIRKKP